MNRWKIIFGTFVGVFVYLFSTGQPGFVAYASDGVQQSDIHVKIKRDIYLGKVVSPEFGTYTISKKRQRLNAKRGLTVRVVDKRALSQRTPWSLHYQLSVFRTKQGKAISSQTFNLGKGRLVGSDNQKMGDYTARPLRMATGNNYLLVNNRETKYTEYVYSVKKSAIYIDIPSNQKAGHYVSQQTIYLTEVPYN